MTLNDPPSEHDEQTSRPDTPAEQRRREREAIDLAYVREIRQRLKDGRQ